MKVRSLSVLLVLFLSACAGTGSQSAKSVSEQQTQYLCNKAVSSADANGNVMTQEVPCSESDFKQENKVYNNLDELKRSLTE